MRISEENRRRNGHVLVWDQPELSLDDKQKNKSKRCLFTSIILYFPQILLLLQFMPVLQMFCTDEHHIRQISINNTLYRDLLMYFLCSVSVYVQNN